MTIQGYIGVPEYESNISGWLRKVAHVTNEIMRGKTNNIDEVTLRASQSTTVVTLAPGRLGDSSCITFMPLTASAAAAQSSLWVSTQDALNNTFTITHTSNGNIDKTFRYSLVG